MGCDGGLRGRVRGWFRGGEERLQRTQARAGEAGAGAVEFVEQWGRERSRGAAGQCGTGTAKLPALGVGVQAGIGLEEGLEQAACGVGMAHCGPRRHAPSRPRRDRRSSAGCPRRGAGSACSPSCARRVAAFRLAVRRVLRNAAHVIRNRGPRAGADAWGTLSLRAPHSDSLGIEVLAAAPAPFQPLRKRDSVGLRMATPASAGPTCTKRGP